LFALAGQYPLPPLLSTDCCRKTISDCCSPAVAKPMLIPYLNGELMPQNGRIYSQESENYQEAGNHTETFVG
jgi:hypothetical protein